MKALAYSQTRLVNAMNTYRGLLGNADLRVREREGVVVDLSSQLTDWDKLIEQLRGQVAELWQNPTTQASRADEAEDRIHDLGLEIEDAEETITFL